MDTNYQYIQIMCKKHKPVELCRLFFKEGLNCMHSILKTALNY